MDTFHSRSTLKVGDKEYEIFRLDALDKAASRRNTCRFRCVFFSKTCCAPRMAATSARKTFARLLPGAAGKSEKEIAFTPSRVLMQDFTGVPAVVDLAAMRDAMTKLGGDPSLINPLQPAELVIDHSVQVDEFGNAKAFDVKRRARVPAQQGTLRLPALGPDRFPQHRPSFRPIPASFTRSTSNIWRAWFS